MNMNTTPKIGIVTCSDRASAGLYDDVSGKAIIATLEKFLTTRFEAVYRLIPDDKDTIIATLIELCDSEHCALVVTTGGTGPALRDVTPEATEAVCTRLLPGFGEQMRAASLRSVPTAILSRQTAGIRGASLVVNLPGKPAAIEECLAAVFPAIPYCLDLIGAARLDGNPEHVQVFRPKQSS
jgi:molybdopterin adenylyltransferase